MNERLSLPFSIQCSHRSLSNSLFVDFTMAPITILTPPLEELQQFCYKNKTRPAAVFKLGWALILHCYFDTCTFLLDEQDAAPETNGNAPILVSFLPELARKSQVVVALQQNGMHEPELDTVLLHGSAENFDRSTQKVSTRVRCFESGIHVQNGRDSHIQEPRVVGFP